jgi:hypothetical protein
VVNRDMIWRTVWPFAFKEHKKMSDERSLQSIPTEVDPLNELPVELQAFLPDLGCTVALASAPGIQALAAIKAAKEAGLIKTKEQCLEAAGDVGKLAAILGGTVAGIVFGKRAECACKVVF